MPVAVSHRIVELKRSNRKQVEHYHPRQAEVETPEREFHGSLGCGIIRQKITSYENEEAHCQHTVNAHHSCMSMVSRKLRADFPKAHDWQVDQKPEDTSAHEVPEAYRSKEHHCPAVRKTFGFVQDALPRLCFPQSHELPCLIGQEHQRDHL